MNIFKVLASGKKGLQEEALSAVIAWFLNPSMEHGLGPAVLLRLIEEINLRYSLNNIEHIREILSPRLRTREESFTPIFCDIEYPVLHSDGSSFIDIVFKIDNFVLCIENKINAESASNINQLKLQYTGICRQEKYVENPRDWTFGFIFLVPASASDPTEQLHQKINDEFDALPDKEMKEKDFKMIVTWQHHSEYISIVDILNEILKEEREGKIDPISEYVRHTMKALIAFVNSDFEGYQFDKQGSTGGLNPATEKCVKGSLLLGENKGFVGVKDGIAGLLRTCFIGKARSNEFQFTMQDMSGRPNWMTIDQFKSVFNWSDGTPNAALWNLPNPISSDLLFRIAAREGSKVYIGIRGGADGLNYLSKEQIEIKHWAIKTLKPTNQWIAGDVFHSILKNKGFQE